MTTDRELLELAAKAYGFGASDTGGTCWTESEYPRGSGLHGALWNYVGHMDTAELWNPLTDDGDAMRLAVELGIDIHIEGSADERAVWADDVMLWADGDALGATRRAIVMAAVKRIAETGLSIQNGESGNG